MKPLITKISAAVFLGGIFFVPTHALFAAEVNVAAAVKEVAVGKEVAVDLFLNTDGKTDNALSGEIAISLLERTTISPGTTEFTLSRIHDGNSVVGAWLVRANTDDPSHVSFSGIIPGGKKTAHGKVLTLYIIPNTVGTLSITTTGTIFANDAPGVAEPLHPSTLLLSIVPSSSIVASTSPVISEYKDITPPVDIRAIIGQNDEMFDGQPFIIVNAKDAESGVHSYELLETPERHSVDALLHDTTFLWQRVGNPAALPSSIPNGFIYLRVTDREGNAAVVEVSHPVQLSPDKQSWLFNIWSFSAILIGAATFGFWLFYRRGRRHHGQ
jgi:hypothetical protein